MNKWLLVFALAGFSVASAKTYTVAVADPVQIGSTQLKPGQYQLSLNGSTAIFTDRNDHKAAQLPVKVETAKNKFENTEVETRKTGNNYKLEQIRLGGTRLELEFD